MHFTSLFVSLVAHQGVALPAVQGCSGSLHHRHPPMQCSWLRACPESQKSMASMADQLVLFLTDSLFSLFFCDCLVQLHHQIPMSQAVNNDEPTSLYKNYLGFLCHGLAFVLPGHHRLFRGPLSPEKHRLPPCRWRPHPSHEFYSIDRRDPGRGSADSITPHNLSNPVGACLLPLLCGLLALWPHWQCHLPRGARLESARKDPRNSRLHEFCHGPPHSPDAVCSLQGKGQSPCQALPWQLWRRLKVRTSRFFIIIEHKLTIIGHQIVCDHVELYRVYLYSWLLLNDNICRSTFGDRHSVWCYFQKYFFKVPFCFELQHIFFEVVNLFKLLSLPSKDYSESNVWPGNHIFFLWSYVWHHFYWLHSTFSTLIWHFHLTEL